MKRNTFVFKDTGVAVTIKRVSPLLVLKLRDSFPRPKPPVQKVVGLDGAERLEENPAHPDYLAQLEQYEIDSELRVRRLLIRRGVEFDWTDERRKEVEELKEFWKNVYGETLTGTDEEIYISYIAIGTDGDMKDLLDAITIRSQPTEEEAQKAKDRFQDNV